MKPTLCSPLMSISHIQICYQLLQTRPTGEKRYQLLQTHPPTHSSATNPQPFCLPGDDCRTYGRLTDPKKPTLKIPPSKAFKYYYVLITIFKKENLVLVSSYKTCFNINSNFIWIKYKYHYFNWNVRVISKRYINITSI